MEKRCPSSHWLLTYLPREKVGEILPFSYKVCSGKNWLNHLWSPGSPPPCHPPPCQTGGRIWATSCQKPSEPMLLPLEFEFLRGWLRDEKRELPREMQNYCHQERGEMSSDQPEFFWQICFLRHISLSSWAPANHSLPASRARRKTGSLSSAPNKRKTNKVTFSCMTFVSDARGAGQTAHVRLPGRHGRDTWIELLGVGTWRSHGKSLPGRPQSVCEWGGLLPEVQNSKSLSSMFSSTVINQEHQPIGTLVTWERILWGKHEASVLVESLPVYHGDSQKLVGQFLQKLTHSLLLPGNPVHGLHLILPLYDDLLFPCKSSDPCFIHYSITHSIIQSLLHPFSKHLLSNKILKVLQLTMRIQRWIWLDLDIPILGIYPNNWKLWLK